MKGWPEDSTRRRTLGRPAGGGRGRHAALVIALAAACLVPAAGAVPREPDRGETERRLAGQLLVATPEMPDPRFMRTVIFMVRHDAGGAMGLVLNRPMGEVPLARLLDPPGAGREEVSGKIRLHYGGPVERTRGVVLHTADYVGEDTEIIAGTVAVTRSRAVFRAIADGTGPRRSFLALGYSGWGAGQLEAEIAAGHWVAVPADEALVFDDDYDAKWSRAMARRRLTL